MSDRVLIVDDEKSVRDLFSQLLKEEKYNTETCASGEEALDLLGKKEYEAVLLDIKLPGMDGFEAMQKIKAIRPSVAVIMITGYGYDEGMIKKCMINGCSGYIGKNMPVSQIISNFNLFLNTAKEKAAKK